MEGYRDYHATIFVDPQVARPIEEIRGQWDLEMAAQIAAHVTLVYPQEVSSPAFLIKRVREAADRSPPIQLCLGGWACFDSPDRGVYLEVVDVCGGFHALRQTILRTPFTEAAFPPHVTLVHPRTSRLGPALWRERPDPCLDREFEAHSVAITANDGFGFATLYEFPLRGATAQQDDLRRPAS